MTSRKEHTTWLAPTLYLHINITAYILQRSSAVSNLCILEHALHSLCNTKPEVRIFWWRTLNNFIPTKGELKRRHIEHEDHCEACGETGESLYHVAITCTFAHRFWEMMHHITGFKLPPMHPVTWTMGVLSGDVCKTAETMLIICGAWTLCIVRNARRHGKDRPNLRAAARHVATMVEDMICLQGVNNG